MYGMGRISNAQSVMMFGTALPMKNWLTSTPQWGFTDLSQKPRTGRNWKIVVKICGGLLETSRQTPHMVRRTMPNPQQVTRKNMTYIGMRMLVVPKMRQ